MPPTVFDANALKVRLLRSVREEDSRIVFVVGSGLTSGTIPNVTEMISAMRKSLDVEIRSEFDSHISSARNWAERYQKAAEFTVAYHGPDTLKKAIRISVLRACSSVSGNEVEEIVSNEDAMLRLERSGIWHLGPGVRAFGKWLTLMPEDRKGRVLTTNFDPLIEIAVREAGFTPATQWIDTDGKISEVGEVGEVEIVHLHGYWRRGDTLHTQWQLTRPKQWLPSSIRETLRNHLVAVFGYGGWKDSITEELLTRIREREHLGTQVLWSSYNKLMAEDFEHGILADLAYLQSISFYGEVDVNKFFPKLLADYRQAIPYRPSMTTMPGWTEINDDYLKLRASSTDDKTRLSFFDGGQPSWANASDAAIPRLASATKLAQAMKSTIARHGKQITLLLGPMGEGKSLALRQAAVDLLRELHDCKILWREPGASLSAQSIDNLPADGHHYLLCSDEADLLIDALFSARHEISERSDIWFLLATHERDWRNAGGSRLSSNTNAVPVPRISLKDANAIIDAWSACGYEGLGQLSQVPEHDRAPEFVNESNRGPTRGGSLIGAMLALRFGGMLEDRVSSLLDRLTLFSAGDMNLAEAFTVIAIADTCRERSAGQSESVSGRILAKAVGITEGSEEYTVLDRLGKEAATVHHGGYVYTRHPSIAKTVCEVARRDKSKFISLIRRLVSAAVEDSNERNEFAADHLSIAYMGRNLPFLDEALTASNAAIEASPSRLTFRTHQVHILREFKEYELARSFAETALRLEIPYSDPESISGHLAEWATVCGESGAHAMNLILDAAVFSPPPPYTPPNDTEKGLLGARRALIGMGRALMSLYEYSSDSLYIDALHEVIRIANRIQCHDPEGAEFIAIQSRFAARAPVPRNVSIEASIDATQEALNRAIDESGEDLPGIFPRRFSLRGLVDVEATAKS